ncbi:MAG: serine/threonine-protein kinase [Deltaproteobacteria bacterium]|nr:serine/threonine-protein kinase [Deltaproteobacteria bacterium]
MHLGRYEVIDEIGAGGMGRVRLARDPSGRLVVLKTPLRNDADDDERLRDEARVGLLLSHPSLVETLDLFEVDDAKAGRKRPVLVTAYVAGVSLIELRKVGPMDPVVVCRLGKQLAEALDVIHEAKDAAGKPLGVLHRDVTAGNCLVGHDGRARLIDLGISRSAESRALRTETGLLRGTLRYLAPELFDGGQYSAQSDLWALGVVLWEALLGRAAVSGSDAVAVGRICSGNLMTLDDGEDADPRVSRAISQLLRRHAVDRPRRAREAAALFAMLEKAVPGDADRLAQAVVWRAIGGPDVEGETSVVERAARTFAGDDDTMAATGPVLPTPGLAETVIDQSSSDPFLPRKTPSQSIADYAASLLSMEKALAAAWNKAEAADRATLAHLPVVTGTALDDALDEGDTLAVPTIPFGDLVETKPGMRRDVAAFNDDDVLTRDRIPRVQDAPTASWGVLAVSALVTPAPPGMFGHGGFPSVLPLPPQTPVVMTSSPPPPVDHDEISTPMLRPAMDLVPAANDDDLRGLMPGRVRPAAVLGIVVLLVVAVAVTVFQLGLLPAGVERQVRAKVEALRH